MANRFADSYFCNFIHHIHAIFTSLTRRFITRFRQYPSRSGTPSEHLDCTPSVRISWSKFLIRNFFCSSHPHIRPGSILLKPASMMHPHLRRRAASPRPRPPSRPARMLAPARVPIVRPDHLHQHVVSEVEPRVDMVFGRWVVPTRELPVSCEIILLRIP